MVITTNPLPLPRSREVLEQTTQFDFGPVSRTSGLTSSSTKSSTEKILRKIGFEDSKKIATLVKEEEQKNLSSELEKKKQLIKETEAEIEIIEDKIDKTAGFLSESFLIKIIDLLTFCSLIANIILISLILSNIEKLNLPTGDELTSARLFAILGLTLTILYIPIFAFHYSKGRGKLTPFYTLLILIYYSFLIAVYSILSDARIPIVTTPPSSPTPSPTSTACVSPNKIRSSLKIMDLSETLISLIISGIVINSLMATIIIAISIRNSNSKFSLSIFEL